MGGRHSHAPVPDEPCLILDIGCGSGAVSVSFALKNPSADVVGVDVTPVPTKNVAPPNLVFLKGDIFELVDKDPRLKVGTAQLVFSRCLTFGMPIVKWPDYIKTMASLAKPGGYVEFVDLELQYYQCSDHHDPLGTGRIHPMEWANALREAETRRGIDMDAGKHLEQRMVDAGLEIVQVKRYPMPCGPWLSKVNPDAVEITKVDSARSFAALISNSLKDSHPEEKIKQYQTEGMNLMLGDPPGCFCVLWAVLGRKPGN